MQNSRENRDAHVIRVIGDVLANTIAVVPFKPEMKGAFSMFFITESSESITFKVVGGGTSERISDYDSLGMRHMMKPMVAEIRDAEKPDDMTTSIVAILGQALPGLWRMEVVSLPDYATIAVDINTEKLTIANVKDNPTELLLTFPDPFWMPTDGDGYGIDILSGAVDRVGVMLREKFLFMGLMLFLKDGEL